VDGLSALLVSFKIKLPPTNKQDRIKVVFIKTISGVFKEFNDGN
jgi:hypothetical protein